jgi:hemolysin activation/secretion protein
MRYQGDRAAEVEGELRWALNDRWSLVGFAGAGWTDNDEEILKTDDTIVAGGFGFRYLVARRLGMHTGIDIAWGPEDTVFYIQVGSAW